MRRRWKADQLQALFDRLSVQEKIAQMIQLNGSILSENDVMKHLRNGRIRITSRVRCI